MAISKVKIQNLKSFKDIFTLTLNKGLNVLVGDNESGKSTILEAIHIALTGLYCGRSIWNELSQYLFNNETVKEYIQSIQAGNAIAPPELIIEIFFDEPVNAELFEGDANSERATKVEGFQFKIAYDNKYSDEYQKIIEDKKLTSLPIEYYEISWTTFARQTITTKSIPVDQYAVIQNTKSYAALLWLYGQFLSDQNETLDAIRILEDGKDAFENQSIMDTQYFQCLTLLGKQYLRYFQEDPSNRVGYLKRARIISRQLQNNRDVVGAAFKYAIALKNEIRKYDSVQC